MQLNGVNTAILGKEIIHYKSIDSTQSEIWRLYEKNISSGTIVIADIQTKGRGTHNRIWYTDEPNNIAFSFLIKPNCNINKLEGITRKFAENIINVIKKEYGIMLSVKEPNDIVFNNKKIGGILTETKINSENVKALVVGVGINTSKTIFNNNIKDIATSIKKEFEIDVDNIELIEKLCIEFEKNILKGLMEQ